MRYEEYKGSDRMEIEGSLDEVLSVLKMREGLTEDSGDSGIVIDTEDIVNYIEEHLDKQISREVIDRVLQLEENYLRSIGIAY